MAKVIHGEDTNELHATGEWYASQLMTPAHQELQQRYDELFQFTADAMTRMGEIYAVAARLESLAGKNMNSTFATWIQFNWKHHQKEIEFPKV